MLTGLFLRLQHFVLDVTTAVFCAQPMPEADRKRMIALLEEWLADEPADADDDDDDDSSSERLRRMYDAILGRLCTAQTQAACAAGAADLLPSSIFTALRSGGVAPSDAELRAQTAGLLFAGLNSAKELKSMLAMLAQHQPLQAEVRAEVDAALNGRPPSFHDLSKHSGGTEPLLAQCTQLVHEALRLSPGIEHLRLVTTCTVTPEGGGGVTLPCGTRLVVSPSLLHRHPHHWEPPCDVPQPAHFASGAQAARVSGCFLPFSAGAKGCPAAGFALHEMRMLLVMVLQRFELSDAGGGGVVVARRATSNDHGTDPSP